MFKKPVIVEADFTFAVEIIVEITNTSGSCESKMANTEI